MHEYWIATTNRGKIKEMQRLLAGSCIKVHAPSALFTQAPPVAETGKSFIENAILKAHHGSACLGRPCVADDSGLCVKDLKGEPGIFSARFGGEDTNYEEKMALLLKRLADRSIEHAPAYFYCAVASVAHAEDPTPLVAVASWAGVIASAPAGEHGFGYDPIFYVKEAGCTAAELEPSKKCVISHRAQAVTGWMSQVITTMGEK